MKLFAKRAISVALAACMAVGSIAALNTGAVGDLADLFAVKANAADTENSCGENLTWSLDSDGLLTISGTGAMTNYVWDEEAPWIDSTVKTVVISDGVTSIGEYAFSGCRGLTSVTIPNSVTSIGDRAFENCTGLTSITIPDSVTSIGDYAFDDCTGLTKVYYLGELESWLKIEFDYNSNPCCNGAELYFNNEFVTDIIIPESVTIIGSYAFYGCTGLTSITIPESVTSIGYNAFSGCTGLTSVTIPDSVTKIGDRAFENCTGLTSVTIPNGVTSIGYNAFSGCTGLTSVTIPDSVRSIGYDAFSGCTGLTSVTIPDGVTSIDWHAFSGCTGLTSITIPDSVTYIGSRAFSDTAFYDNESNWENGVLYICNHLIKSSEDFSGEYNIKPGTKVIAGGAFEDCSGLTGITIPDSVTSIGDRTFSGCSGLTSVTIPDSVTSIGGYAFSGCTGLASVKIPDSVTEIGQSAFSGCRGLTSVTLGNGVTGIALDTFHGCISLTSVTIPDGATYIGDNAFRDCSGLTSITIPDSVTSIGECAFDDTAFYNNKSNWKDGVLYIGNHLIKSSEELSGEYSIKPGTKVIASYAFYKCTGLTSVTIPDSVTSIGWFAFYGCTGLTNITIPDSVTSVGGCAIDYTAFSNDKKNWEDGVLYCGNHLIEASSSIAKNYKVKAGTKTIAHAWHFKSVSGGFLLCDELESVIIPDGVISIGSEVFSGLKNLKTVTIPESVTSINNWAFVGCAKTLTIVGVEGSYAQTYAKENGINFEIAEDVTEPSTEPTTEPVSEPTTKPTTVPTTEPSTEPTASSSERVIGEIAGTKTVTVDGASVLVAIDGVTVSSVRSAAQGAKIVDRDGKEVSDDAPLATGMKIVLGGEIVEIAVLGDIDGDAKISVADARLALRQAVSLENLQGVYLLAGKVGSDTLSVSEARTILRAAVNLEDSKDWLK